MPKNFSSTAKGMTTLPRNSASLVAPGSFQMDQSCPGSVPHMVYFQFCTLLTSMSPSAQETTSSMLVCTWDCLYSLFLATTGKPRWIRSVHESSYRKQLPNKKRIHQHNRKNWHFTGTEKTTKVGWSFLLGLPSSQEFSAFRAAEKQHHRD